MSARLRWKREPAETGLRRIGAGPRGSFLHDGERTYATVSALGGDWRMPLKGWYFVVGWDSGVPRFNSYETPAPDEKTAKEQAMAYVREHLSKCEAES